MTDCIICGSRIDSIDRRKRVICGSAECRKKYLSKRHAEKKSKERTIGSETYPKWTYHCDKELRREIQFYWVSGQREKAHFISKMNGYDDFLRWWRNNENKARRVSSIVSGHTVHEKELTK
ncbi:MAG: hypothetical protein LRY51_09765 [Geovibrio sp.]|nr:hypothetical protein [Geovibrio sp.]